MNLFISLLTAQHLCQAIYQILPIIFLKKFIGLNVNSDVTTKNMKHVELNMIIASVFSNIQTLKMI